MDLNTDFTARCMAGAATESAATANAAIDAQQDAIANGGNGYALINGIRLYVSSTAPTGDIPDGSVGVGW